MEILARFLLAAVNSLYFVHHHAADAASLTRSLLARPRPRRPFPWPKLSRLAWWVPTACIALIIDALAGMVRDGAARPWTWACVAAGTAGIAATSFAGKSRDSVTQDQLDALQKIIASQQQVIDGYQILMSEAYSRLGQPTLSPRHLTVVR